MKKIFLTITTLAVSITAFAQNKLSTISGTWEREGSQVCLFSVVSGRLEQQSVCALQNNDRSFAFAFAPKTEGYYVVGAGDAGNRFGKYIFYFKPGDNLSLAVNDTSYVLTGDNTRENIALTQWHDYIRWLEYEAFRFPSTLTTYVEFFPALEEAAENEFVPARTGNKTFDESFAKYRKFSLMHCATYFIMTLRTAHPEDEDFPDYYRTLSFEDVTANADVLVYPYFRNLVSGVAYVQSRFGETKISGLGAMIDLAQDENIKAELFLALLGSTREYAAMEELKAKYEQYITSDDQQKRLSTETDRIMRLHLTQGEGKPGPNFTYKDVEGNAVSFSDFKGKIVYVDVWATWCGPCRREFPYLKEVEKEFHGNDNIVFVGISSDADKDIQKWKDFVATEGLPGVQLHGGSDITKLFQINGIPRFMLFDKEGNIVSIDAPRPSSSDLLPLLKRLAK